MPIACINRGRLVKEFVDGKVQNCRGQRFGRAKGARRMEMEWNSRGKGRKSCAVIAFAVG
jgi:hypothetical protein